MKRLLALWLALATCPAAALTPAPTEYWVLFDLASDRLTDLARAQIPMIAEVFNHYKDDREPKTVILVEGQADRSGPARANLRLSCRRAAAVREALIVSGIARDRIVIGGTGETDLLVPTRDGVAEPNNRRVRLRIGMIRSALNPPEPGDQMWQGRQPLPQPKPCMGDGG